MSIAPAAQLAVGGQVLVTPNPRGGPFQFLRGHALDGSAPPTAGLQGGAALLRHSLSRAAFAVSGLSEKTPSMSSAKNCLYSAIALP